MSGLNKVMLIGHVGAEPELRHTSSGGAVMNLRLATNETWKDKQGERQERTEWHTLTMWGARAEALAPHLAKGSHIYVEGRLQTRKWKDREGNDRYSTEVNLTDLQFLGGGKRDERAPQSQRQERAPAQNDFPQDDFGNDDIPF